MSIKTEGLHAGEFLLSEANGTRSREEVVITAGAGILPAGTLIGKITAANAGTPAAVGGNVGNGAVSGLVVASAAITGVYSLAITAAAANGGAFELTDPMGALVGVGNVGAQFVGGGLTFTLGDGAVDFAVGDRFTLTVVGAIGEYRPYDDDGTDDGRRACTGILFAPVDATINDIRAVAIVRDAEVIGRQLTGLDAPGRVDLLALGIIIRP
ncbi:MAG: head decoration protein [Pseudomonas sp.]